jgi:toxin ParE1/3/4
MGVIRRSAKSYRDYTEIWEYIARDNVTAADQLLLTFDSKLHFLSDFPGAGQPRPELRPRLRSFPVGAYLIFYRPIRGGIHLLRVIHGARDLRQVFKGT